jgi:hypothetical protein
VPLKASPVANAGQDLAYPVAGNLGSVGVGAEHGKRRQRLREIAFSAKSSCSAIVGSQFQAAGYGNGDRCCRTVIDGAGQFNKKLKFVFTQADYPDRLVRDKLRQLDGSSY